MERRAACERFGKLSGAKGDSGDAQAGAPAERGVELIIRRRPGRKPRGLNDFDNAARRRCSLTFGGGKHRL